MKKRIRYNFPIESDYHNLGFVATPGTSVEGTFDTESEPNALQMADEVVELAADGSPARFNSELLCPHGSFSVSIRSKMSRSEPMIENFF